MWFAVNILLAPYSAAMQRDLAHVRTWWVRDILVDQAALDRDAQ
jgi:hypothetical protein